MYQSLYRKYRPKNFDEVIGQESIVRTLKNAILNDQLNHAYIFAGPRGTGKTSIAKILARTINCENPCNAIPCGECVFCTENSNQLTDIIEIDAASNNGVDEIRELKSKINLVPTIGKYKIYIIDEVHMLTIGAFNALLKTLEEPPQHIIFILATTEPQKIPVTILSRCQRFDFKKISSKKIEQHLKNICELENINVEQGALEQLSILSEGCMRDALSILEEAMAFSNKNITLESLHEINGTITNNEMKLFLLNILEKKYEDVFEQIDLFNEMGKNYIKIAEEFIVFIKNIILKIKVPKYFEKKVYDQESFDYDFKKYENELLRYIKVLNSSIYNLKNASNSKVEFELIILNLLEEEEKKEFISNKVINKKTIEKNESNISSNVTKKTEPVISLSNEEINKIEKLKKIRVNNTLCNFNKKQLLEFKNRIDEIRNELINPDFSKYASLILDSDLKAFGNEYMIFMFNDKHSSDLFNLNIGIIENMFFDCYNEKFKIISVSKDEWELIKNDFNSKKKVYNFIEEDDIELKKEKKEENNIDSLFENIIEYK